jgi:hypothetical protein
MKSPDQRAFEADLCEAEFRIGFAEGQWGTATEEVVPDDIHWPRVVLWIASAKRPAAPDRFYVLLDCANYKTVPPTGTFWDPVTKKMSAVDKRPKGKSGSRVARVFRTDWNNGSAFYHPYDRVAAQTHPNWANEQPHLIWGPDHTIVNLLDELHVLLNSEDYVGIS